MVVQCKWFVGRLIDTNTRYTKLAYFFNKINDLRLGFSEYGKIKIYFPSKNQDIIDNCM